MYRGKAKKSIMHRIICLGALTSLALTGCASSSREEDTIVMVEQEEAPAEYSLAAASTGDVVRTQKLKCTYRQAGGQEVSFSLSGRQITAVHVEEGDSVVKGQLLAELSSGNLDERMQTLEYQIERNKLLLEQARTNEDYEISAKWLQYIYQSGQSEDEREALSEAIEGIQRNYRYTIEDCQDAIELDQLELTGLQEETAQSRVYAQQDGTVSYLKSGLEGATSARDEVIMTIMDSSECMFETEDMEYAGYIREGDKVEMDITSGTGAGKYYLVPWNMEQWDGKMMFALTEEEQDAVMEVGTTGTLKLILEQREQVLKVPVQAVHQADGRAYVYILGENRMREVKWIETGLYGDDSVEVTAGLTEGEKVILK